MNQWTRRLVRYCWHLLAVTIIGIAIIIQLGRELSPLADRLRPAITDYLSQHLNTKIDMGKLQITWKDLRLQLIVEQLTLYRPADDSVLQVDHASLQLDLLSSLLQRQLIWQHIVLYNAYLHAEQNSAGVWNLAGFSRSADDPPVKIAFDPSDWFVLSQRVELRNTQFLLDFRTGQSMRLAVPSVTIENDDDFHRLEASIDGDDDNRILYLVVEGSGDPRDRATFAATGFLELKRFPIDELLAALPRQSAAGGDSRWHRSGPVDMQLWIDFLTPNAFAVQGHFAIGDIRWVDSGETVAVAASVTSSFSGTVDLEGESSLSLHRVDIDKNDQMRLANVNLHASADNMAIHIDRINLGPWFHWLTKKPFLEHTVKQALGQLGPTGVLNNIALTGAINDWRSLQLRANIIDADLGAWKKVPSIKGISGYIETTITEGFIALASERFRLFPRSLLADELQLNKTRGRIAWHLQPQQNRIIIHSGPLHSDSGYGQADGAFYLDLPWTPRTRAQHFILYVGLRNGKVSDYPVFLPTTLPENLQTWLAAGIDRSSGKIATAGFIYHGTLGKPRLGKRSIQFFADISGASLTYSPQWPSLTDIEGRLVIDNQQLVADIKRARIYDAEIDNATVYWPQYVDKYRRHGGADHREHLASGYSRDHLRDPPSSVRQLYIEGFVTGPAGSGLRLLQESELKKRVGTVFNQWTADGNLQAHLQLDLPLLNPEIAPSYTISINLDDSQIHLHKQKLSFTDTNGEFTIDSHKGFLSSGINTTLWGHPLAVTFKNSFRQGIDHLAIAGQGRTDMGAVARWLKRPELLFGRGETDFVIDMHIPLWAKPTHRHREVSGKHGEDIAEIAGDGAGEDKQSDDVMLTLQSDLQGIAIDLPAPFTKEASEPLPLTVRLAANHNHSDYDIHVGRWGRLLLAQEHGQLTGGAFRYRVDDIPLAKGKWSVTGYAETVAIDEWQSVIERYRHHRQTLFATARPAAVISAQRAEIDNGMGHDDLGAPIPTLDAARSIAVEFDWSFDAVDVNGTRFNDVDISAHRDLDQWLIAIDNADATGTISVFDDRRPATVHFEKLHWPYRDNKEQETVHAHTDSAAIDPRAADPWAAMDFSALPAIDFSVDHFAALGKTLGSWQFKLRPIDGGKGLALNELYGEIGALTFTGDKGSKGGYLRWRQGSDDGRRQGRSQLTGVLTGGNIKPLLDKWQLSPLESKKTHIATTLSWTGSPYAFAMKTLVGDMTVSMDDGRFIREQNSEATDLLRLFGLFNFDTWARRIRLDFSDLYKSGLSFDQLKGDIEFDRGTIYLTRPLAVKGPSSNLNMAGKIDYDKQQIDTSLVATLPVGGNLTLGIALTAGLPAAAGAYVISKLFKDQVEQVASLSYTIKGDWENPQIRFDKLFDKKAAKKAGQTAKKEKQMKNQAQQLDDG